MTAATVLIIPKEQMLRLLHEQPEFPDRFIASMLTRNIRIEEDVVDQLFISRDGVEFVSRLRGDDGTMHKPIIMLATCASPAPSVS